MLTGTPVVIQQCFVARNYIKHYLNHYERTRDNTLLIYFFTAKIWISGNFEINDPPDFNFS